MCASTFLYIYVYACVLQPKEIDAKSVIDKWKAKLKSDLTGQYPDAAALFAMGFHPSSCAQAMKVRDALPKRPYMRTNFDV